MSHRDDQFQEIKDILTDHSKRFDRIEARMDRIEQRMDTADQRMDRIEQKLDHLTAKVEENGQIIHKVGIYYEDTRRDIQLILEKLDSMIHERPTRPEIQEKFDNHEMRISNLEVAYKTPQDPQ